MTSLCYQECIGVPSRIYDSGKLQDGLGQQLSWHQRLIHHPTAPILISLSGPGSDLSSLLGSLGGQVYRQTKEQASRDELTQNILCYIIKTSNVYISLVFILGKNTTLSYSRLQQPPEPKDDFFFPRTHMLQTHCQRFYLICSTVETRYLNLG